jgi:hypothetical protein
MAFPHSMSLNVPPEIANLSRRLDGFGVLIRRALDEHASQIRQAHQAHNDQLFQGLQSHATNLARDGRAMLDRLEKLLDTHATRLEVAMDVDGRHVESYKQGQRDAIDGGKGGG